MSEIYSMPGHLIRRLNQISISIFTNSMAEINLDITPVQYAALSVISTNPGIDQAGLAGMIAYDCVTIGGVVNRLVQKKLITRMVSKRDRRARELVISAAGEELLKELRPVVKKLQPEIMKGLTETEAETFLKLLKKTTEAGNEISRAPLRHGNKIQ